MFNGLSLFNTASALATHASGRQSAIARNIANSDTPEYHARDLPAFSDVFEATPGLGSLRASRPGHLSESFGPRDARLQELVQPGDAAPNGNTVSVETEMMRASEVRHQHDMALSVYRSGLTLLRTGLGRGR